MADSVVAPVVGTAPVEPYAVVTERLYAALARILFTDSGGSGSGLPVPPLIELICQYAYTIPRTAAALYRVDYQYEAPPPVLCPSNEPPPVQFGALVGAMIALTLRGHTVRCVVISSIWSDVPPVPLSAAELAQAGAFAEPDPYAGCFSDDPYLFAFVNALDDAGGAPVLVRGLTDPFTQSQRLRLPRGVTDARGRVPILVVTPAILTHERFKKRRNDQADMAMFYCSIPPVPETTEAVASSDIKSAARRFGAPPLIPLLQPTEHFYSEQPSDGAGKAVVLLVNTSDPESVRRYEYWSQCFAKPPQSLALNL